jgi:hypothetical protein
MLTFIGENQYKAPAVVQVPISSTNHVSATGFANLTVTGWLSPGPTPPGWTIQPTPNPSGGSGNVLQGVSCSSATNCIAVGSYNASPSSYTLTPLAEHWDGSTWGIQPIPGLPSSAALTGISCTSGTSCTAVGYYNNAGPAGTLAAHWNGSAWSTQATPNPSGGYDYSLAGVSCASATNCTAVGGYDLLTGGVPVTLAEHWNGSVWKVQATANRPSAAGSAFEGVSCGSAISCTAVGYDYENSSINMLVEHWNGSTWSIQATPDPSGGSYPSYYGVSCSSATSCVAVGGYLATGNWQPLAEYWNGSGWSIQAFPAKSSGYILHAVSCPSTTSCTAVGRYGFGDQVQAEYWDGSAWSAQDVPNPSSGGSDPENYLDGISCTLDTSCTAIGYYDDADGTMLTLAESN